jgi:hypothetical protein
MVKGLGVINIRLPNLFKNITYMKKYLIILMSLLLLFSCNNQQSKKINKINKTNNIKIVSTRNPILLKFVNFDDSSNCVLKIIDNNVTIIENNNEINGKFSNSLISTSECDDCYRFGSGDDGEGIVLNVFSPEGNFINNYYFFDSESSSISYEQLQEYLGNNSFNENEFQGQILEVNERVVKINWEMENTTKLTKDYGNKLRYCTEKIKVPNGKVWVLLYINEHYNFTDGVNITSVPKLFVDNKSIDWTYGRNLSHVENILLSKSKIENLIFHSNQSIKAISDFQNDDEVQYQGEMWFLETTMNSDLQQKRNEFDIKELKVQNRILHENIYRTNSAIQAKKRRDEADRRRGLSF